MIINARKLKGTYDITLEPNYDPRGFFMRIFDKNIFKEYGIDREWVQENHSRSKVKGIVRGLHLQMPPFSETKLIRAVRGEIYDVFVDLRKDSPTFMQWDYIELSEENNKMIYIPRGFAHGFCTLTDDVEVVYKVDNVYSKEHEVGILWSDNKLGIKWPVETVMLSDKDKKNISIDEFIERYKYIEIEEEE